MRVLVWVKRCLPETMTLAVVSWVPTVDVCLCVTARRPLTAH